MADAQECRRQCHACVRSDHAEHARSWVTLLANQMDRLEERDPVNAAHIALSR
jgi:hypothetical protein